MFINTKIFHNDFAFHRVDTRKLGNDYNVSCATHCEYVPLANFCASYLHLRYLIEVGGLVRAGKVPAKVVRLSESPRLTVSVQIEVILSSLRDVTTPRTENHLLHGYM